MTAVLGGVSATLLEGAGIDLGRVNGTATMDESRAPHVQADLTIALPDEATLDLIDPRELRRIRIDATATYPGSFIPPRSRSFNLGVRDRRVNQEAGEVLLSLASDEALLMDDVLAATTPDIGAYTYSGSVRGIVNNVLARIGASLQAGTTDAPFHVVSDGTNMLPNPSIESGTTGYSGAVNATVAQAAPAGYVHAGAQALRVTASAAGDLAVWCSASNLTVAPNTVYTFAFWVRPTPNARQSRVAIRWFTSGGATISDLDGTNVLTRTDGWTLLVVTGTSPATAAGARPLFYALGCASGERHYIDDGGFWAGAPNERDRDALAWQPGVSAWDFLQPIWQSLGYRLFCDEQRRWYLVNGSSYIAPGTLQLVMPGNLHTALDTIARDSDEWFDAVVARYRWRDSAGVQQERVDVYAPAGHTKTRLIEIDRAYVGPGFAAYAVKRAEGRGREDTLEALADLTVIPSQVLSIELPDTPQLLGVVRSVTYDLTNGTMRVSSRGLTDVPAGAWALTNPTMTWSAAPAAVVWNNWINPNGV